MTKEQVEKLDLGIVPIDSRTIIMVESAFNWINDNTRIYIDYNSDDVLNALEGNVKLFVINYVDIMNLRPGVSSESLGGMSQSFDNSSKSDLLWQYAYELFGNLLKSQMSFVTAKSRWY